MLAVPVYLTTLSVIENDEMHGLAQAISQIGSTVMFAAQSLIQFSRISTVD